MLFYIILFKNVYIWMVADLYIYTSIVLKF